MGNSSLNVRTLVIKGQHHYLGNIRALFEANTKGFPTELEISGILEPEPTNAHDPNAVILRVRGYVVGYISQEIAAEVKNQIGSGVKVTCKLLWNRDPVDPVVSVVITEVE